MSLGLLIESISGGEEDSDFDPEEARDMVGDLPVNFDTTMAVVFIVPLNAAFISNNAWIWF